MEPEKGPSMGEGGVDEPWAADDFWGRKSQNFSGIQVLRRIWERTYTRRLWCHRYGNDFVEREGESLVQTLFTCMNIK